MPGIEGSGTRPGDAGAGSGVGGDGGYGANGSDGSGARRRHQRRSSSASRTDGSAPRAESAAGDGQVPTAARPLRIAVISIGTRGDVQPFIALGCALKAAGHDPMIVTTQDFGPAVTAHGIRFGDCGLAKVEQPKEWLTAKTFSDVITSTNKQFLDYFDVISKSFLEVCEPFKPDALIVMTLTMPIGKHLAERLGCACWSTLFFPALPSWHYAAIGAPLSRFGFVNMARHVAHIGKLLLASHSSLIPVFRKWRQEVLGLPLLSFSKEMETFRFPVLGAFSESLFPRDSAWGKEVYETGFWFLDGDAIGETTAVPTDAGAASPLASQATASASATSKPASMTTSYKPPRELVRFLLECETASADVADRAGDGAGAGSSRPVCVNFGSMVAGGGDETRHFISNIVKEVVSAGFPVVLVGGWNTFDESLADDVAAIPGAPASPSPPLCTIQTVPHEWLFPRCACVIFHGGAGTAARVAHSCVPGIVVPVLKWSDQPGFGHALQDRGCGVLVPDPDVPGAIASAVRQCCTPEAAKRAASMGARIQNERGVATAVELMQTCLCERMAPTTRLDIEFCLRHCVVCRAVEHDGGRAPLRPRLARVLAAEQASKRRAAIALVSGTALVLVLLLVWWFS